VKRLLIYLSLILLITCSKDGAEDNSSVYIPPPTNTTTAPTVTQYTLTVTAGNGGSVSTTGGTYNDGTSLSISASANEGYSFSGWSNGSSENPLSLTLNSNTSITANFEMITYSLTVTAGEGGSVSPYEQQYEYGSELTLNAIPNEGYFFHKWIGETESYQDELNITFDSNKEIQAVFFQANNCLNETNEEVFNGINFKAVNSEGNKAYNCLITNSEDGHPVFSGNESARFELRTESGDCGYTTDGFSDCDTDRSRHEISEEWIPEMSDIIGKKITYEYYMYIPETNYFTPNDNGSGKPLTVLSQIFSISEGENLIQDEINSSNCDGKALLYFVMEENKLKYLTHKPFTWNQNERILIKENPFNQWIKINIEIYSSLDSTGYIKLFVDDELIDNDIRATMCSFENPHFVLKLGIYNSYISEKNKPFLKQVVYYDDVKRTIE